MDAYGEVARLQVREDWGDFAGLQVVHDFCGLSPSIFSIFGQTCLRASS